MRPTAGETERTSARRPSWWQDASTGRVLAAAVLFSATLFLVIIGFDYISARAVQLRAAMVLLDAAVAALCGALLFRIVRAAQARHRMLVERLTMIAELNHNIRNALDAIQLSAHTTHNQKLIEDVQVAVTRVQRALRDVVPLGDEDEP